MNLKLFDILPLITNRIADHDSTKTAEKERKFVERTVGKSAIVKEMFAQQSPALFNEVTMIDDAADLSFNVVPTSVSGPGI
jgi:hypothetical protein